MNILSKIKKKIEIILTAEYSTKKAKELDSIIDNSITQKNIYYFNTPTHSNLGDQAQYYCWIRLFSRWYPDYNIISVPQQYSTPATIQKINSIIKNEDKIFIHSGYLIYDPHPELLFLCNVVDTFINNEIVILPQTINIKSAALRKLLERVFNAHDRLTIISRDEVSYSQAIKLFYKCKNRLMPDVVTSLIGNDCYDFSSRKRKNILFCIRRDGEKFYADDKITLLRKRLPLKSDIYDTSVKVPIWVWEKKREKLLLDVFRKFAKYKVIITDRYHGTIFSQIQNTPVIVINSADHKLSSGVKWFPRELFGENVFFANDLNEAYEICLKLIDRHKIVKNPDYFYSTYYCKPILKI